MSVEVLDTGLGEIKQQYNFEWDVDSENWREYRGLSAGYRAASGSSQRDQYDLRIDVNRQRWNKRLIPVIERFIRQKHWQELIFTGEKLLVAELERHTAHSRKRVLSKNLNRVLPHDVLREVYTVIQS